MILSLDTVEVVVLVWIYNKYMYVWQGNLWNETMEIKTVIFIADQTLAKPFHGNNKKAKYVLSCSWSYTRLE